VPLLPTVTNFVPSAEEATDNQPPLVVLFKVQVDPELVDVYMELPPTATHLLPSPEDARDLTPGTLFDVHVVPEFVEL
jgi:hypothetical protein